MGRGVRAVCWPGAAWCQPRRMPGSCALCRSHHGHCVLRSEIIHHQVTSPRSGVIVSTLAAATAASSCTQPSLVRRHLGVSPAGPASHSVRRHQAWRPTAPPSLSTPVSAPGPPRHHGHSFPGQAGQACYLDCYHRVLGEENSLAPLLQGGCPPPPTTPSPAPT